MSVFAILKKKEQPKVPNSSYIKTEDESGKDSTPTEQPVKPDQPEEK